MSSLNSSVSPLESDDQPSETVAFPTPLKPICVLYGTDVAKSIWARALKNSCEVEPSHEALSNAVKIFLEERDQEDAMELLRINACEISYERSATDEAE
jgi:hypothetical protein